jgi:hypothetical protein
MSRHHVIYPSGEKDNFILFNQRSFAVPNKRAHQIALSREYSATAENMTYPAVFCAGVKFRLDILTKAKLTKPNTRNATMDHTNQRALLTLSTF